MISIVGYAMSLKSWLHLWWVCRRPDRYRLRQYPGTSRWVHVYEWARRTI